MDPHTSCRFSYDDIAFSSCLFSGERHDASAGKSHDPKSHDFRGAFFRGNPGQKCQNGASDAGRHRHEWQKVPAAKIPPGVES